MGDIVLDSSALFSLLLNEDDAPVIAETMKHASLLYLSAASYAEAGIVIEYRKFKHTSCADLDHLLKSQNVEIMSVDAAMARLVHATYRQYGKGRHKAALNMGDCFSYALAKSLDIPLLYKGDDFCFTDIAPAMSVH